MKTVTYDETQWKLMPSTFSIPADAWEAAQFAFGGPGTGDDEPFFDCTAWVGECEDDDGTSIHGLHISCDECPEDGSVTLAEFPAAPEPPAQPALSDEMVYKELDAHRSAKRYLADLLLHAGSLHEVGDGGDERSWKNITRSIEDLIRKHARTTPVRVAASDEQPKGGA